MIQPIMMTVVDNQVLGLPVDIQHKVKPLPKVSQVLSPDLGPPSLVGLTGICKPNEDTSREKVGPRDPGMRKLAVLTWELTFALWAGTSATQLHKLQPETLPDTALSRPLVREGAWNEKPTGSKKPHDPVL
ncbi:folate transporter-like protein C2orf83 homolog [Sapajus apella]|uniref:Folate transporter-like protein C2orf83 homolog n=1 Tax=Sapajus apella TaxID=9515 RepID=A0A6J3HYE0_SAPAP|nr:folate transporter-like protein C2orf83 homolog [Sapajus apella]